MSTYLTQMNEALEGVEAAERQAKEAKPVTRYKKGEVNVEAALELAETLAGEHGWVADTKAIRDAGKVRKGENDVPVLPVALRKAGQGKGGFATGRNSAMIQVWHSGAALITGDLPEGIDFEDCLN